jgi:hypothetical protein
MLQSKEKLSFKELADLRQYPDQLVDVIIAAQLAGVSRSKLDHDRLKKIGIPFYNINPDAASRPVIRYRVSDILQFQKQCKVEVA